MLNRSQNKQNFHESQEKSYHGQIDGQACPSENCKEDTHLKSKKVSRKADERLKITGLLFGILFLVSWKLYPGNHVNSSEEAAKALATQMSTELPVGVSLMSKDEQLSAQDLTITHSSMSNEEQIFVWDYAAEDGDYVQILVGGVPIGDAFMIKKKPVSFKVPTTGEIKVLGIRDGGGGITYAIHYDVNGTTYFNGTDAGNGNLYTLIRE